LTARRSPIYRSAALYELTMLALYRRHRAERLRAIAELIPSGARVVEACCGPGLLYRRHLRGKGVRYTGLDLSPAFVRRLVRAGVDGRVWDVREDRPLPAGDYVVMQGSLYQFLPDASPIVDRMLAAAREEVIVAEPVRNLTHGPWVTPLARLGDPGTGPTAHRFDERGLEELFSAYGERVRRSFALAGGRERAYVLAGSLGAASSV
jgi:SAM-dependent methyltransferase